MFTETQLKLLKEKLAAEKSRLETQIKNLEENVDFGDDIDHLEEEADETEEIANVLGMKASLQKQLDNINAALEKTKKNTYGACERCGKEISFHLLEVDPESKLCQKCKTS